MIGGGDYIILDKVVFGQPSKKLQKDQNPVKLTGRTFAGTISTYIVMCYQ